MTEPLVKQIVDLKEEHELMLQALKLVLQFFNSYQATFYDDVNIVSYKEMISAVTVAKVAAEMGNERRLAKGNVDLPDRRGMKDGTT